MVRVGAHTFGLLLHIVTLHPTMQGDSNLWSNWWSYYGISGPDYWGRVNHEWTLCSKGLYQSPVDISPRTLVYDPNLRPVRLDQHRVDGHLINTGNDITYQVDPDFNPPFLISGGPLSYTYRVHYIKLHFGRVDQIGSEHTVSGKPFPLELQFLAFNKDLYTNYSHASKSPHGVAAVAVFGMIAEAGNKEFSMFIEASSQIRYKGHNLSLSGLSIRSLFPSTADYMTYEGSLTQPSCHETVTWIVFNKPVYVTKHELRILRQLHEAPDGSRTEMLMEDNFRPTMALNRRTIRTNIAPKEPEPKCGVKKITFYEVNDRYRVT